MTPTPGRTESIFAAAVEIASEAERRQYVVRACAGDDDLRREVEQLVADHARAGSFLEPPAGLLETGEQRSNAAPGEASGTVIGNYKLLQQIGEGGMGTVFMAEQARPVKRTVALKIVKRGMDSRQVIARFEAERQALALMDHPNIARVLDAGTTEHGRPFFVMELVKGVPITQYCDKHRLTTRERLELFVPVCHAVQHAHQKGIIHRDLKPSNVMVCLYDGRPVPKVIDFGVAKAAGPQLTDRTLFTAFGSVVGTLEYMSPEQAELNQLDVDTRSDVYSLGVLLYELLTGTTPLERGRFERAALLEVLRLIREEEPPRPSTRLSTSKGLPSIAANRGIEPKRLSGAVRGELDWIVMKALEKDRTRRYETASGLAADVRRHLDDEAVLACPPSGTYRLRKFARRNRGPVLAGFAVVLALVAGIVGTTWGLLDARAARAAADKSRTAETDRATGERLAKETAQKRLGQIEKGYEILGSVFADLDPDAEKEGKPLRALLGERLERATRELEGEAVGDPLAVAKLQVTLARSHRGLGSFDKSAELAARAYATFGAALGPQAVETLTAMRVLASAHMAAEDYDRALPLFDELLKRETARRGPRDELTILTMEERAVAYLDAFKVDLGAEMLGDVARLRVAISGPATPMSLAALIAAGRAYHRMEDVDKSLFYYEDALELQEGQFGPDHVSTHWLALEVAAAYLKAKQPDKALPMLERAFQVLRAKLGPDHPKTRVAIRSLGAAYQHTGATAKAVPLARQDLASLERLLGPDHPETILAMCHVGVTAWTSMQPQQAIPYFERALRHMEVKPGRDAPETLGQRLNLGMNYAAAGRAKEAIPHLEEVLARGSKLDGFMADKLDTVQQYLAMAYGSVGEHEKANDLLAAALHRAMQQWGPDHAETAGLQTQVGNNLTKRGKFDEAVALLGLALATREKLQPENWSTFYTRSVLGEAFLGKGELDKAERLLLDGYEGVKTRMHQMDNAFAIRVRLPEAIERLARLAEARGKPAEAAKWRAEAAEYTRAREAEEARRNAEHE